MARAFTDHQVQHCHPAPEGHKSWWSRDRVLMLQMYDMARVPIVDTYCRKTLLSFWKDSSKEVLTWLAEWLKSGAASSVSRDQLPVQAVNYIRSVTSANSSWWPAHPMELDTWCLTTGVVSEERLFEEWTASSAPAEDGRKFFEAELREPPRLTVPLADLLSARCGTGRRKNKEAVCGVSSSLHLWGSPMV